MMPASMLKQLTPHVYVFPMDEALERVQPNIGVIHTESQTILIDAGNGPRRARQLAMELAAMDLPPVRTVIYTHHHWDHIFGAQVYHAPTIIAHETCHQHLQGWMNRPLGGNFSEPRSSAMNLAINDWRDFHICLPSMTFSRHLTLYFDGITLELSHFASPHSNDGLIVYLPEQGVRFVGDGLYPSPSPTRPEEAPQAPEPQSLRSLLSDETQFLIAGHHSLYQRQQWLSLLQTLG
jgi:glyoxylase-like metal-dependent hydrolase (beta-lactamase superfamily II)